jgi:hypothetical protein
VQFLKSKKVFAVAVVVGLVAFVAGAAIAAGSGNASSPGTFLDSLAQHLGISTNKLEDATKAAAIDQVDAALKEGRITKAQADELKARIKAGGVPLIGPGFGFFGPGLRGRGFGFGLKGPDFFGRRLLVPGPLGRLSAAATYLGLTEAQLQQKLAAGQSLAAVAKAQGKSVDGLEQAILDATKKKLDQLVADGVLTKTQANELSAGLKSRIDDLVNRSFPGPFLGPQRFFRGPGQGFRFRGGPLPALPPWGAPT